MIKKLILKSIRAYQKARPFYAPFLKTFFLSDEACRFSPTCSNYCYQAIKKYGTLKGLFLSIKRIVRCHPWSQGGLDPVK